MQWTVRNLVWVSIFISTASFGWFNEFSSRRLGLELGQIAVLEVIIVLESLVAIAESRVIVAHPGISFYANLAG